VASESAYLRILELVKRLVLPDLVPGDSAYSPFWSMFTVPVTDSYRGELIPSLAALEEAQRIGIVGAAEQTDTFANCPVVADDVRLDLGPGQPPLAPIPGFYRGLTVSYIDFNAVVGQVPQPLLADGVHMPIGDLYTVGREGSAIVSEPVRGVDITGDGDLADTNDVLAIATSNDSPLRRVIEVTAPRIGAPGEDVALIDTTGDQAMSDVRAIEDMFTVSGGGLEPRPDRVVAIRDTGALRNLPFAIGQGAQP